MLAAALIKPALISKESSQIEFVQAPVYLPPLKYPCKGPAPLRLELTAAQVPWSSPFPDYDSLVPDFTDPSVIAAATTWADPLDPREISRAGRFNRLDGNIMRNSFMGVYEIDGSGRPIVS